MKVLVTGVGGFVGAHLVALLRAEHPQAVLAGIVRPGLARPVLPEGVEIHEIDLEDAAAVEGVLARTRPDRVVHLAAQSSVHVSWEDPAGTVRTNVLGLLHLLEAARRHELRPRTLVVGSSEEYGMVRPSDLPLREEAPLRPNSPYAVSKVSQGFVALLYTLSLRLPTVRTRTFHHTGPGRGEGFAESAFARQIAEIEAGQRPPVLSVGNLEAVRDFADVRDVVRAYWLLLERGEPGEVYNVCTGRGVSIRELLDRLLTLSGVRAEVQVDPGLLRPSDVPALIGDPAKLRAATGWEPRIPLDQTLTDLLEHWRARVRGQARPATPQERR